MYKKWTMAALMLCAANVSAIPMYYTFTGTVRDISDGAGIIADANVTVGTAVEYVYLVDFDLDGTLTLNSGSTNTQTDDSAYNYFYTDFISGSLIEEKDGGSLNGALSAAEYNYGYYDIFTNMALAGDSQDQLTQVTKLRSGLSLDEIFTLGVTFEGREQAYSTRGVSWFYSDLTLTGVSSTYDVSTVPLPAAAWLFGSAMLGFLGFSRRKRKA